MKKIIIICFILLFLISLNGCKAAVPSKNSPTPTELQMNTPIPSGAEVPVNTSVIYKNTQYGFSITLPENWKGYSIATDTWIGIALVDPKSGEVVETGEIIYIRHPQWTAEIPRQDIPIMIFAITQWDSLNNEEFSVGAAPMPPSEINRSSNYVFALPARYNYAYQEGYQEVEDILKNHPLQITGE